MNIRAFQEPDEPQVIALWDACGLLRSWNNPHADIARKLTVQREWFLVGCDGHRGWINYLAVAPSHRLQGHAAAMMQHVQALLLAAGCSKLNLQVRAGNHDAIAFYQSMGYLQEEVVSYGKRLVVDTPSEH